MPEPNIEPEIAPASPTDGGMPAGSWEENDSSEEGVQQPQATPTLNPEEGKKPTEEGNEGEEEQGNEGAKPIEPEESTDEESGDANLETIITGWREDRVALGNALTENRELKSRIVNLERDVKRYKDGGEEEEDEYAGLSPSEREAKIIEKHEAKQAEKVKVEKEEVAREKKFKRSTSQYFAKNEPAILKTAVDYNCSTLDQAEMIYKSLQGAKEKAQKATAINTKRKANADGKSGGGAGGVRTVRPYDPKTDGEKSVAELIREGGIS